MTIIFSRQSAQKGSALVISLIFLLVLTLLGLAAMRDTGLQERMAGNFDQRQQAFQLAELGLRTAEREYGAALRLGSSPPLTFDVNEVTNWPSPPTCPDLRTVACSGAPVTASAACMAAVTAGAIDWVTSTPQNEQGVARYTVLINETQMGRCTRPSGITASSTVGGTTGSSVVGSDADKTRLFIAEGIAPDGTSVALVQAMFLGPDPAALTTPPPTPSP